jgi:hypothetical protein
VENSLKVPQKLNIAFSYDSVTSLLDISEPNYWKNWRTDFIRHLGTPKWTVALFTEVTGWNNQMSIDGWMDKQNKAFSAMGLP